MLSKIDDAKVLVNNKLCMSLCFFLLLNAVLLNAQIINVENLRHDIDSIGWSGHVRLGLDFERNNTSDIFNFSNQLRLQYKNKKSLWFLIHDMDYKEVNSNEIKNNSTQHLRYSYTMSDRMSYEAFLQSQSDAISEIKLRALVGTGVRFSLYEVENYKFFWGQTMMYEHENSADDIEPVQNNIRNSTYVSFKLKPNENLSLVSTNYYQPLYNQFSDYRFLSESSLLFKVVKNLKFMVTFYYRYDSFPVTNVAKEQFKLTNGLIYFFD